MAPLSVTLQREDPPAGIVALLGENDGYVAERLESELQALIDSRIPVVVDLSEATFVDSQVLSVLLSARYEAKAVRLAYALVLPDTRYTQVHRLLDMTGLYSMFEVHPTSTKALESVRGGSTGDQGVRAA